MTDEVRSLAIIPRTLDECTTLAERLAKSELLPKALRNKVPDVLMTIMAGQEMGLKPMVSIRSIHIIEGQPRLSADGMVAIIHGSGKCVYFDRVEESDKSVTYETLRVDAKEPRRCTWTMEMAKTAALHLKDNWRAHPRAMLAARAKSELARDVYPDVLAGCYTMDEIPDERIRVEKHVDAVDAEFTETPPSTNFAGELLKRIEAVETFEQLTTALEDCKQVDKKDPLYVTVRKAYKAKESDLKTAALQAEQTINGHTETVA
jgi:hypothetical protein